LRRTFLNSASVELGLADRHSPDELDNFVSQQAMRHEIRALAKEVDRLAQIIISLPRAIQQRIVGEQKFMSSRRPLARVLISYCEKVFEKMFLHFGGSAIPREAIASLIAAINFNVRQSPASTRCLIRRAA
jgi:hypothetical protein